MRKTAAMLALGAVAMAQGQDVYLKESLESFKDLGYTGYSSLYGTSPIYIPKKHTVESYRSQQRRAKKRRK